MTKTEWSTAETAKLARCTERQLQTWDETKIASPSRHELRGRGGRSYDLHALCRVRLVAGLRSKQIALQRIRKAFQGITVRPCIWVYQIHHDQPRLKAFDTADALLAFAAKTDLGMVVIDLREDA